MESFDEIYARAVIRHDGEDAVEDSLHAPKSSRSLSRLGDDRYLSAMAKCIFRSGFVWQIIEKKWPGFQQAFHEFDVRRCAMLSDEELEALGADERIVRNGVKIRARVEGRAAEIRRRR